MSGFVAIAKKLSPIVLIAGGGMLAFAFFMPWWGITMTKPEMPERPKLGFGAPDREEKMKEWAKETEALVEKRKATAKIMGRNERWYEDMYVDRHLKTAMKDADEDTKSLTVRLWGWNTGTGITALILGLLILPLGIVPIFVAPYRRWSWIGSYVAAVIGLVMLIMGMVFYFGSPGRNAEGLSQGVGLSPGPYMVIFGSLATLASGVFGGVFGMIELIKSQGGDSQPRRKKKRQPEGDEFDNDDMEFDEPEPAPRKRRPVDDADLEEI